MPYIDIKSIPKDADTVKRVVDQINELMLKEWGCPPQAISISYEEVPMEEWAAKVEEPIMAPKEAAMMIRNGEKKY